MSTIRTLIIDDEPPARELIRSYLKAYPDFEIIGECINGFEGLKMIQELKPDLIFLDIEMPKVTGLEMLELVEEAPLVIFSTAYQEYAINAFEMNAIDYLLKPFTKERFKKSIDKIEERILLGKEENSKLRKLFEQPPLRSPRLERVVVKTITSIKVIPVSDITYMEAQDDYVMIYTSEGKFLKQQTMKYFEQSLPPERFLRIHRSYIINIDEMLRIEPYEKTSYQMILKGGAILPVSRNGYSLLKEWLDF